MAPLFIHPATDFPAVTLRYTTASDSKLIPPTLVTMVHRTNKQESPWNTNAFTPTCALQN